MDEKYIKRQFKMVWIAIIMIGITAVAAIVFYLSSTAKQDVLLIDNMKSCTCGTKDK